jgi:hypothetical protein
VGAEAAAAAPAAGRGGAAVIKMTQHSGMQYFCDLCQMPLLELTQAIGIWRPLEGPQDCADVLIIHAACRDSSLARMLLPKHNKGPLGVLLSQADEAINR